MSHKQEVRLFSPQKRNMNIQFHLEAKLRYTWSLWTFQPIRCGHIKTLTNHKSAQFFTPFHFCWVSVRHFPAKRFKIPSSGVRL